MELGGLGWYFVHEVVAEWLMSEVVLYNYGGDTA